jgi:hypothetical protein
MIFRTQAKGDWTVIELKLKDILRASAHISKALESGNSPDYFFFNVTDNQQFRIEVKK